MSNLAAVLDPAFAIIRQAHEKEVRALLAAAVDKLLDAEREYNPAHWRFGKYEAIDALRPKLRALILGTEETT